MNCHVSREEEIVSTQEGANKRQQGEEGREEVTKERLRVPGYLCKQVIMTASAVQALSGYIYSLQTKMDICILEKMYLNSRL